MKNQILALLTGLFLSFGITLPAQNTVGWVSDVGFTKPFYGDKWGYDRKGRLYLGHAHGINFDLQASKKWWINTQGKYGLYRIDDHDVPCAFQGDSGGYCDAYSDFRFVEAVVASKYLLAGKGRHRLYTTHGFSLTALLDETYHLTRYTEYIDHEIRPPTLEYLVIEGRENCRLHFFINVGMEYGYLINDKWHIGTGLNYKVLDLSMNDRYRNPFVRGDWMLGTFVKLGYVLGDRGK